MWGGGGGGVGGGTDIWLSTILYYLFALPVQMKS